MKIKFNKAKAIIASNPNSYGHITSEIEEKFNNFLLSNDVSNVLASGNDKTNAALLNNKINIISGNDGEGLIINQTLGELIFVYLDEQKNLNLFPPVGLKINDLDIDSSINLEGPCVVVCELENGLWNVEINK